MRFKNTKFGFTLAEVLIVIGVIGVVAALTIPTLIKNHQKKVWVNQLKTSVVKIQDAFRLAMAEDGVDDLGETELWSTIPRQDVFSGNVKMRGKEFTDKLSQYIKVTAVLDSEDFSINIKGLNVPNETETLQGAIQLLNGTMLYAYNFNNTINVNSGDYMNDDARINGGAMWKYYGDFFLDVNGQKGPNQLGRDIFWFNIAQNGLLYPVGGKDVAIYYGATLENYKENEGYWNQNGTNNGNGSCNTKAESVGVGCAARIIEEGWKMNY